MKELKRRAFLKSALATVMAPTVLQTLTKASAPVAEVLPEKLPPEAPQPEPQDVYIFMYKGFCFTRHRLAFKNCYTLFLEVGNFFVSNLLYDEDWDMLWERCCDNMIMAVERNFGYKVARSIGGSYRPYLR